MIRAFHSTILLLMIVIIFSCKSTNGINHLLNEDSENADKNKVLNDFIAARATPNERSKLCEKLLNFHLSPSDLSKVVEIVKITNENHMCLVELLLAAKKKNLNLESIADNLWQVANNLKPGSGFDNGRYVHSLLTYFEFAVAPSSNATLQQSQFEFASFLSRSKDEKEKTAAIGMFTILSGKGDNKSRVEVLKNLKSANRIAYEYVISYPDGFKNSKEVIEIASSLNMEDFTKYASFGQELSRGTMADVLIAIQVCPKEIALKSIAFVKDENKLSRTLTQERISRASAIFRFLGTCAALKNEILSSYAQTIGLLGKESVNRYIIFKDFLDSLRKLSKGSKNNEIRKSLESIRPWTAYTDAAKKTRTLVDELLANLD